MIRGLVAGLVVCTCSLWADFSYEQTSRMTGGAMYKMMATFSKQMREPMVNTVLLKGDRMAHVSDRTAVITDLRSETITTVDFQKRTYSVVTFAEMAEAMREMDRKMTGKEGANLNFKVSVKRTGQSRQIAGMPANEVVMTLTMEGTDKESGQQGGMSMITDMWMAPDVPGYGEVRDFYARMSKKVFWVPGAGMGGFGGSQPQMMKSMTEAAKEIGKMDGVPVFQVMKMMAQGQPAPEAGGSAQTQQTQTQEEKPSIGSVLGGRFGGFGRRKKQQDQTSSDQSSAQTQAQNTQSSSEPGVLMETTTELKGFSSAPVDGSKFEIPAGFKQVESETLKRMKR